MNFPLVRSDSVLSDIDCFACHCLLQLVTFWILAFAKKISMLWVNIITRFVNGNFHGYAKARVRVATTKHTLQTQLQRLTTLKNHKHLELIMDIQAILTLTIQAVVMSFVALMVFDFIDGLWVVPLPPIEWEPSVIEQPTVFATSPQPTPQQEIQQATPRAIAFEKISPAFLTSLKCRGAEGKELGTLNSPLLPLVNRHLHRL
jgi:hypothetical protein